MKHFLALASLLCVVGVSAAAPLGTVAPKIGFGVHGNFTQGSLPGPAIDGTKSLKDAYGLAWVAARISTSACRA
jgi:hypothetical protein